MDIGIILPLGVREKEMALLLQKKLKSKCKVSIISFVTGENFTSPLDFDSVDDETVVIFDSLQYAELIPFNVLNRCWQRIFLIPFDLFIDLYRIERNIILYRPKIPKENVIITSSIGGTDKESIVREIYSSKERKLILSSENVKINDGINLNDLNSDEIETFIDAFNNGEIDNIISPYVPTNISVDTIIIFENYLENLNDALYIYDAKKKMAIRLIGDEDEMDDVQDYYNERYDWWEYLVKSSQLLKI